MLMGKRPMKRTTSIKELNLDRDGIVVEQQRPFDPFKSDGRGLDRRSLPSDVFVETAPFLKSCFLCKRGLISGRDIYIYRGDSAFCSLECRQQQMTLDERREKYFSSMSKREVDTASGKGEIVAAAM